MTENKTVRIPTDEEIRERAYQIYLDRGREDGQDLADWLTARRELEQSTEREPVITNKAKTAVSV